MSRLVDTVVRTRRPLLVLPLCIILRVVIMSQEASAQEGIAFFGMSPPVADSSAVIVFPENLDRDRVFEWISSDPTLGEVDTGLVTASIWRFFPGPPARLVFVGSGGGASLRGDVLFGDYNRAVVDIAKGPKRVRYLLTECGLNLLVELPSAEISQGRMVTGVVVAEFGISLEGLRVFVSADDDQRTEVLEPQPLQLRADNTARFTLLGRTPGLGNAVVAFLTDRLSQPRCFDAAGLEVRSGDDLGELTEGFDVGHLVLPPGELPFDPPYFVDQASQDSAAEAERKIDETVGGKTDPIRFDVQTDSLDYKKGLDTKDNSGRTITTYGMQLQGYVFPKAGMKPEEVRFVNIMSRTLKIDGAQQDGPDASVGPIVDGQGSRTDPRWRRARSFTKGGTVIGKEFPDAPSISDPWVHDEYRSKRLEISWKMKTWVLTGSGGTLKYYGRFEWAVDVDLDVGTNKASTVIRKSGAGPDFRWVTSNGRGDGAAERELREALGSRKYRVRNPQTGRHTVATNGDFGDFTPSP